MGFGIRAKAEVFRRQQIERFMISTRYGVPVLAHIILRSIKIGDFFVDPLASFADQVQIRAARCCRRPRCCSAPQSP